MPPIMGAAAFLMAEFVSMHTDLLPLRQLYQQSCTLLVYGCL